MRSHLLAATIALTLVAVPCVAAHAGGRVALVIGMSGYRHAPALKNPANDAKDMSTALRELGFTVTEAADLDKRALDEAVRTFAHRIAGADAALVFFGGHGLQVAGQNYLLPIDAKLESERDLDFETVRLEFILRQMESGRNGKVSIQAVDGTQEVSNRYGQVDVHNITGTVQVENRNGSVTVQDVAESVRIRNRFSVTAVKSIGGSLDVENRNGSVEVSGVKGRRRCGELSNPMTATRCSTPPMRDVRMASRWS